MDALPGNKRVVGKKLLDSVALIVFAKYSCPICPAGY
jgi:hypothetical protein